MSNLMNRLGIGLSVAVSLSAFACGGDDNKGTEDGTGGTSAGTGGASATGGGGGGGNGLPPFDAGTDPNRNKVTPGKLCQRTAEIQCAGEAHCCPNPGRDVTACIEAAKKACSPPATPLDDVAADAITGFDAAKAEAAFTAFEQKASQCDLGVVDFAISPSGLRGVVTGTRAAGAACDPVDAGSLASIGAALASCTDAATQACLPTASTWTCAPRSAAGGDCFTDVNCVDGNYCDNPTVTPGGGKCKARKATGETCAQANECTSLSCSADGKCQDKTVQTAYCIK